MPPMTEEELRILESLKDPKAFIERFFFIVNRKKQRVPFIFNHPQTLYYAAKSMFDLILKARKEGFSSVIEAINLHACLMFENEHAVTMGANYDETKVHLDRINYFLDNLGTEVFKWEVTLEDNNQKEISFPATNSKFWIGTAGAKTFGRGRDITRLHCTEVAHYEDQKVLTAALGACTDDAWRVLETTANGVGEMFHTLWEKAADKGQRSEWKPHFFAWFQDPANQRAVPPDFSMTPDEAKMKKKHALSNEQVSWYQMIVRTATDPKLVPQEYPCDDQEAFISSGRHVFNLKNIAIMMDHARAEEPEWVGELFDDGQTVGFSYNPEGRFEMWKNRREGRKYLIAADVAQGIPDGAFSVGSVFDRSSWEVVAQFRARLDPGDFGGVLATMGYFFNNAILCPESNNMGAATFERLKAIRYPHILNSKELWPDVKNPGLGFPTNVRTKGMIISTLRNAINELSYVDPSPTALREMQRAVWNDKGEMESEGAFLDCVISRGIGLYCLKFLTLDDSYRDDERDEAPLMVTSITPKPRGRAGYR